MALKTELARVTCRRICQWPKVQYAAQ
uniref:Transposase n=1 Tax=Macrostomum lignano TaxID=282301 RepID=A0A1I8HPA6_9PLAT